ncbi:phospholipid carrier-dependent glycosyltransferase [Nocardioides mangrovicus]|uniref:phospholipid carrier-dependent glycosyltransferase n=1 Tax=Nocardioides mangrovicus TaxID=2478913 RepID=UPI0013147800|nr:phospholipid carrier-dependent glycosyltransferase [Nocardioides mangrovicus]
MRRHRLFLVALLVGALVRVLVTIGFWPGLVFSDGPTYLGWLDYGLPWLARPVGYSAVLEALSRLASPIVLVVLLQHVLGLIEGVLVYAVLRRWEVSARTATLAALPVLLDGMQLALEQSVLSDTVFVFVLVLAVAVLARRRRPGPGAAAAAGLLLGLATVVRVAGEPTVLAAVLFCLLAAAGWRRRLLTSAVLVVAFVAPLAGYATWFHAYHDRWAISEVSGRSLYMRTTTFVDCRQLTDLPTYERTLCPDEPLGQRLDPTDYGWHSPDAYAGIEVPAGMTRDQVFRDFALRAIRAQPGDYARTVLRDAALLLSPTRGDAYEYDTAHKWLLSTYAHHDLSARSRQAYTDHGAPQLRPRQPVADVMAGYQHVVYLWGPLVGALVLTALAGLVRRRRNVPLVLLTLALGVGLTLLPILSLEFIWRYSLPLLPFVPMAAAAAWPARSADRVAQQDDPVVEDARLQRSQG